MTLQDLRQLPSIKAEIKRLSRRLDEIRLDLAGEEDEETKKLLTELYNRLTDLHKKQLRKENEIMRCLEMINDAQIRISVQLHFIDGLTWNRVADEIGGGNTENSCRKYVSRYFENSSDMSV